MADKDKVLFSWSGGKDSALALHEIRQSGRFDIVALLTTVAEEYRRVSHHGVREELLELQAQAIGLPLEKIYLPTTCSNDQYEETTHRALMKYSQAGVNWVAYGDIFLQDLRAYRERNLAKLGLQGLFPLWLRDTTELVRTFVGLGFKAHLSCVDGAKLDKSFAGRVLDATLLRDLPVAVDPCGENGEYHTFVFDGPVFGWPIPVQVGQVVERDQRYYADLYAKLLPGAITPQDLPPV